MTARRDHHRLAFSLLEAILALAIICAALVAVLQVRAQMIKGAQQVRERQAVERDDEAIFRMLVAGLLPEPETEDGTYVWRGEYHEQPFTITRHREQLSNPNAGVFDHEIRTSLTIVRYELTIGDRTTTFPWYE